MQRVPNISVSRVTALFVLLGIGAGCQHTPASRTITEDEFRVLQPFEGQVTAIERLEWPKGYRPTSMSGPDYRVTISRVDDGSTIIIDRLQTTLLTCEGVVSNLAYSRGKYPEHLFKPRGEH